MCAVIQGGLLLLKHYVFTIDRKSDHIDQCIRKKLFPAANRSLIAKRRNAAVGISHVVNFAQLEEVQREMKIK